MNNFMEGHLIKLLKNMKRNFTGELHLGNSGAAFFSILKKGFLAISLNKILKIFRSIPFRNL